MCISQTNSMPIGGRETTHLLTCPTLWQNIKDANDDYGDDYAAKPIKLLRRIQREPKPLSLMERPSFLSSGILSLRLYVNAAT